MLEDLSRKDFWMNARIFITFSLGIHIFPLFLSNTYLIFSNYNFSHFSTSYSTAFLLHKSKWHTYSNVILNQKMTKAQWFMVYQEFNENLIWICTSLFNNKSKKKKCRKLTISMYMT